MPYLPFWLIFILTRFVFIGACFSKMVINELMKLLKLKSESFGEALNEDILSDKSDKNCSALKLLNDR